MNTKVAKYLGTIAMLKEANLIKEAILPELIQNIAKAGRGVGKAISLEKIPSGYEKLRTGFGVGATTEGGSAHIAEGLKEIIPPLIMPSLAGYGAYKGMQNLWSSPNQTNLSIMDKLHALKNLFSSSKGEENIPSEEEIAAAAAIGNEASAGNEASTENIPSDIGLPPAMDTNVEIPNEVPVQEQPNYYGNMPNSNLSLQEAMYPLYY